MKIFITGGLGFIGRHLSNFFLGRGYQVTAVGIRARQDLIDHENFHYISADTAQKGSWQDDLQDADAVINLAGKTIFRRWTQKYKNLIYDSRILTTRNLVEALPQNRNITLCSASATGFYGNGGEDTLTENSPGGNDFLAKVGKDWEAEALLAEKKTIRTVVTRFGIVLGNNGGMMAKTLPAFRFYLGGPLGSGRQWFPWIHIDDVVAAFMFVLENQDVRGPLNFCAPAPVRNKDFSKTLGRALKRPAVIPAPAFVIRLIMGEFGDAILSSQRVIPEKLLDYGFTFKYPDIEKAIAAIVNANDPA